jgi:parvulin-like peptidyl-prolyl isomerase
VRLLVERAQLEQKAPGLGVNIDDSLVAARLLQLKRDAFGGSDARYRARLREERMTDADVRSALRAELLSAAVYQAVTVDVTVPTPAVKRYYETHVDAYSTPPARAVRHILVRTKAAAGRVYASLRSGVSFAGLAGRYSRDTSTASRGGLLTLVAGQTAPALDRVAFSLATGAVSRPFETRFGWEIVQALEAARPRRTTPFASVRDAIRRKLLEERRGQAFQRWLFSVRTEFAPKTAYAEGFEPPDVP